MLQKSIESFSSVWDSIKLKIDFVVDYEYRMELNFD